MSVIILLVLLLLLVVVPSSLCSAKTKARFPLPKFTARVHGPSSRVSKNAVNSARGLGPSTRVVETGLNSQFANNLYAILGWVCSLL